VSREIATPTSVKKVVTCSRQMAILSHKEKMTTLKMKKNKKIKKYKHYFYSDVVKNLMS
jgi:hypothetical protein